MQKQWTTTSSRPTWLDCKPRAILLLIVLIWNPLQNIWVFIYSSNWLGQSVVKDLRIRDTKHIINLRLLLRSTPIGIFYYPHHQWREAINDIFSAGLIDIIADVLSILVVLGFMFYTDWRLALGMFGEFAVFIYCTYLFKEGIKNLYRSAYASSAYERIFVRTHKRHIDSTNICRRRTRKTASPPSTKPKPMPTLSLFGIIRCFFRGRNYSRQCFGYYGVVRSQSSAGRHYYFGEHSYAFILYLNMVFAPLRMLADRFNTLQWVW